MAKINFWNRILYAIGGVDAEIAEKALSEKPSLRSIGLQLIGIFVLLFLIQGYAFTTMLGHLGNVGWFLGLLSASIILVTDRVFIYNDFLNEGELCVAKYEVQDAAMLNSLRVKRIFYLGLRYVFGIVVSIIIVQMAEPGFLRPEVFQNLKAAEMERNSAYHEDVIKYESIELEKLADINEQLSLLLGQEAEISAQMQKITLDGSPNVTSPVSLREARELESLAFQDEQKAIRFDACADAERTGVVNTDCIEVIPSGVPKCGEKCKAWANKAKQARATAKLKRDRVKKLLARAEEEQSGQVQSLDQQLTALKSRLTSIQSDIEFYRGEKQYLEQVMPENIKQYTEDRKSNPSYDDSGESGIVRSYNAVHKIRTEQMEEGTKKTLFLLKIFVIFLESIVFTSRLFGTNPIYSTHIYMDQKRALEKIVG